MQTAMRRRYNQRASVLLKRGDLLVPSSRQNEVELKLRLYPYDFEEKRLSDLSEAMRDETEGAKDSLASTVGLCVEVVRDCRFDDKAEEFGREKGQRHLSRWRGRVRNVGIDSSVGRSGDVH
jgi:hypothetical protein